MNQFIEYVCRGVIRSEDAIKRLNKSVSKLAKCNKRLGTSVICLSISGLLTGAILMIQDKEIRELKKQVADLTKDTDYITADVTTDMEDQTEQEGA